MSAEASRPAGAYGVVADADETRLIERYFAHLGPVRADVRLGIGDDAALLRPQSGYELVMTTDTLVEGSHFLPGADAHSLGHRAMAVNLSDIAAMGGEPCWALLSLTLPTVDHAWLEGFCSGFGAQLQTHAVALAGGNLARGPLNIGVQLCGQVPASEALTRTGARSGDLICVSGTVGDAAAGRELAPSGALNAGTTLGRLRQRFDYPQARVALGRRLRGLASACIDVSDGLWRDLRRLVQVSGCGANVVAEDLPLSAALREAAGERAIEFALHGGEDYELLFTLPPARLSALQTVALETSTACTVIGVCDATGVLQLRQGGVTRQPGAGGFDHFSSPG